MTSPEARLAVAVADAWAPGGPTLVAGFGDAAVADAAGDASLLFEQDLRGFRALPATAGRAAMFGPFVGAGFPALDRWGAAPPDPFSSAVIRLPKATEHLRMMLAMTRATLTEGARVVLVGANDAGIRSAGRHLRELIGEPEVIDYRFHCRALLARATTPAAAFDPAAWRSTFREQLPSGPLAGCSYPGVFSHGELDPGTRLLLETLQLPKTARVLDAGCGAGVIASWVARAVEGKVHAIDVSALALHATFTTAQLNDVADRVAVWGSDLFSDVTERYTHIVSNAPFHEGVRTSASVARRLIAEAPEQLERGGELWLVANRFLDHGEQLAHAFPTVTVEAENGRFRVWRARR